MYIVLIPQSYTDKVKASNKWEELDSGGLTGYSDNNNNNQPSVSINSAVS
jgi:hypothetical protein